MAISRYSPSAELVIALVNNMPAAARPATEQQFYRLLTTAAQVSSVPIRVFAVATPPDGGGSILDALRERRPDGLIVTGTEPLGQTIAEEPLWPVLAQLVDWAADHTRSAIWSCLAAHMAVFRLDGLSRAALPGKLSGVFTCTRAADHPLLESAPPAWPVPHSRHNGLSEAELRRKGYTILSHAPGLDADGFVRQTNASLFLLLQGHPEYGPDTLFKEFRRDVRRFLLGQRDRYPDLPEGYLEPDAVNALTRLREQACRARSLDALTLLDRTVAAPVRQPWFTPAVRLYARWLGYLSGQQTEQGAAIPSYQWRKAS